MLIYGCILYHLTVQFYYLSLGLPYIRFFHVQQNINQQEAAWRPAGPLRKPWLWNPHRRRRPAPSALGALEGSISSLSSILRFPSPERHPPPPSLLIASSGRGDLLWETERSSRWSCAARRWVPSPPVLEPPCCPDQEPRGTP